MFDLFNDGFLRHPQQKHNPCYRKVISYSYFKVLKDSTTAEAEASFDQMVEAIEKNQLFTHEGYLEIYPTIMNEKGEGGYLVVEPNRSCFPLVVYPDSHTQFDNKANKTRTSGFKTAVGKLRKNRYKIFELLDEHDEWTLELEAKLEELFEYPKKRSAANSSNFGSGEHRKAG